MVRLFHLLKKGNQVLSMNAGQLGLGSSRPESSRPGSSRPGPHIKPGGNVFNKKEFILQKLEEGCLILRNIILCAAYSIFYTAPGTLDTS